MELILIIILLILLFGGGFGYYRGGYYTRGGGYGIGGILGVVLIVLLIVWLLRGGGYVGFGGPLPAREQLPLASPARIFCPAKLATDKDDVQRAADLDDLRSEPAGRRVDAERHDSVATLVGGAEEARA